MSSYFVQDPAQTQVSVIFSIRLTYNPLHTLHIVKAPLQFLATEHLELSAPFWPRDSALHFKKHLL